MFAISQIRLVEAVNISNDESSEEYIINTKTNQVDINNLPPKCDELYQSLMRLYLESESFPVEM